MPIVVTDLGLQAIRNADAGGFLINLRSFQLTEETAFTPEVTDDVLAGTPIYGGFINTIEALGSSSVKLTLSLPKNFPTSGSVFISEVGVYLDSGELFAHGKLDVPFEKNSEFGFDIYVIVSAARLGDVINVTDSLTCSIAATPHVRTLLPPSESLKNVVSVLDETTDYRGSPTGSLAVKFGSGSIHWSFVGFTRMYHGYPTTTSGLGNFGLDIEVDAGFWLNDGEVVIVQIIAGPGAGQSRKVRYNKTSLFTVLEQNFTNFTTQSLISIWREDKNALPARTASIPDHYMLQKGQSDWGSQQVFSQTGALLPHRFTLAGNNSTTLVIPSGVVSQLNPLVTPADVLIFKNAADQSLTAFNLLYNAQGVPDRIQLSSSSANTDSFDITIFAYDISSQGASVYLYEAIYDGNAATTFPLPIIPDSKDNILAYLDGNLVTNFNLVGAQAVFTAPVVGELALVPFTSYEEIGISAKLTRLSITALSGQQDITTNATITQKKDTLVFVNGKYIKKDNYSIKNNTLISMNTPLTLNDKVDLFLFYSDIVVPTITNVTGRDTGPYWADPAGFNASPNSLTFKHFAFSTDGSTTSFNIDIVDDIYHLLCFVDGQFQYPSALNFYQYSDKSVVRLQEALPAGRPVDIIAIKNDESSTGEQLIPFVYRFTTTASFTYGVTIPSGMKVDSWMIFIGGVYQHRAAYTFNSTTGSLTLPSDSVAGRIVEFYAFSGTPALGYRTEVGFYESTLDTAVGTNRLAYIPSSVDDTMAFIGSVYQNKNQYGITTVIQGRPTGYVDWTPDTTAVQNGNPVCTIAFYSELPETRLVLRNEFQECCDAMWDAISQGGGGGGGSSTIAYRFTATAGQTAFNTNATLSNNLQVTVRGAELATTDYSVGGSTVTLIGLTLPSGTPVVVRDFGAPALTGSSYTLPIASAGTLGGVKVGSGLAIDGTGVLSATGSGYTLPTASAGTIGGIRVGAGLAIDGAGILSATGGGSYTLPVATATTLGGVKAGSGVTIAGDGTLSVGTVALGGSDWVDKTSSRAANTTYQNTTGKPLGLMTVTKTNMFVDPVNLLISPTTVFNSGVVGQTAVQISGYANSALSVTYVPPGWYYRIQDDYFSVVIDSWWEASGATLMGVDQVGSLAQYVNTSFPGFPPTFVVGTTYTSDQLGINTLFGISTANTLGFAATGNWKCLSTHLLYTTSPDTGDGPQVQTPTVIALFQKVS